MEKIKVIVNGLPGKMASAVAVALSNSEDLELVHCSLTGPEIRSEKMSIPGMYKDSEEVIFSLYEPSKKNIMLMDFGYPDIFVDFTAPEAIMENVAFYCEKSLPFVLGTTGGDIEKIRKTVTENGVIDSVVAPNMAKEIVAFQAMLEFAADTFPGAFSGYSLEVTESHQPNKKDTSGTAKNVINSFNLLGVPFEVSQIKKKRSVPEYKELGIPEEFWSGHGWHTYTLKKNDQSVMFQFTHNVNGRQAYIDGTLSAIKFLAKKEPMGKVYDMIDVLINL